MDVAAVMREIDTWPIEKRISFVEAMWDRILDTGNSPTLTEAQRLELDRRIEDMDRNPEDVVSVEMVRAKLNRTR